MSTPPCRWLDGRGGWSGRGGETGPDYPAFWVLTGRLIGLKPAPALGYTTITTITTYITITIKWGNTFI